MGLLKDLPPELVQALLERIELRAAALANAGSSNRLLYNATTEQTMHRVQALRGQDFKLNAGETWTQALRFTELQAAAVCRSWAAVFDQSAILAAKTYGLVVRGTLRTWREELISMPEGRLAAQHQIVQVATSGGHVCAVTKAGKLLVGGDGEHYQLGLGLYSQELGGMVEVGSTLSGLHVASVAAGKAHTAVVTADGHLFTFGTGPLGHGDSLRLRQLKPLQVLGALVGLRVVQVSAGNGYTAVVTADGQLYTFGNGYSGQLGCGTIDNSAEQKLPTRVLANERVVAVACGDRHTVVLTAKGAVFTCGSASYGQLGHPQYDSLFLPQQVEALADYQVVRVAAGCFHTAVLTDNGVVLSFGLNHCKQLGRTLPTMEMDYLPGKVDLLTERAVNVVAGGNGTGVLTEQGRLVTIGGYDLGNLDRKGTAIERPH
jgi:hypothetical protein